MGSFVRVCEELKQYTLIHSLNFAPNAELTGGFSVITAAYLRVITEVPLVQRLVPEARSAEEPTGGPGTG